MSSSAKRKKRRESRRMEAAAATSAATAPAVVNNSRSDSKLTPELHARFVEALRVRRVDFTTACDIVRVHRDTAYGWLERGRAGIEPYEAFLQDVLAARAEVKTDRIGEIEELGKGRACPTCTCKPKCIIGGDARALTWTAERMHPELQITTKVEHQVQQSVEQVLIAARSAVDDDGNRILSEEAYGQFIDALARVRRLHPQRASVTQVVEAKRIGSGESS